MARMSLDTAIRLSAEVKGGGNIDRVKREIQSLAKGTQLTRMDLVRLEVATRNYGRANDSTIAGIRSSIGAFRGLQEQVKIGSREFQRYGAEIQKLEGKLRGLDGTASQTNTRIAGMAAVAGRLIAAYAGIEAVRFVFGNAAELESQTRSLEVLTGSAERAKDIVQQLQQLGAVTPFTSTELIDTAKRLQAFGIETEKVVDITRRLADVSGATGAELGGLATAYGQVQAKGRLQGEELLQFQERGVALQQVLRKEYGLTSVEFQKALEKGQISAEAVEYALRKLTDTGGKYANGAIAQSDTLRGQMSTLTDSVQVLAQTIGKTLEPVFKWALTQATAVVSEIQRLIDEANNTGGARDREAQYARNADTAVRAMGLNPLTQQGMMAEMRQRNIEQQRADYELARQRARAAAPATLPGAPSAPTLPPLSGSAGTAPSSTGSGTNGRAAAAEVTKGVKELLRLTDAEITAAVNTAIGEYGGLDPRGRTDVFANILARSRSPQYPSNLVDVVTQPGQYAPNFGRSRAQVTNPNLYGRARFEQVKAELMNPQMLAQSIQDVDSRLYFKGISEQRNMVRGVDFLRAPDQNFFHGPGRTDPGRNPQITSQLLSELGDTGSLTGYLDQQTQAAEQLRERQQATTAELEKFIEARTQAVVKLNQESELLGATTDLDRRRLEYAFEQLEINDRAIQAKREFQELEKQLVELGIDYNAEQQLARIESEKEHALKNAQVKAEQDINDLMAERVRMMQQLTSQAAEPAAFQTQGMAIEAQIATLKDDLAEMTSIATLAGKSAETIGGAFGNAFRDLISGAASARQVLAGFFQDVAQGFAQMAAEIIAKQMAMIALQTILKALGAVAGGGSTFAAGGQGGISPALGFDPGGFAAGDTGIPFFGRALGGGVSAGRPYPVGENGPELFVPYQAGTIIPAEATEALQAINNASLRGLSVPFQATAATAAKASQQGGGSSSSSGLSVPFQRGMEGLSVPFQRGGIDGGMGAAGMGAGGGDSTIRFESVVINSEELVTRKQAEAIGRRSEQRGAALALKRYKNNPTDRRGAGLP
jgi:tape measure domain-containing protein